MVVGSSTFTKWSDIVPLYWSVSSSNFGNVYQLDAEGSVNIASLLPSQISPSDGLFEYMIDSDI